MRKINSISRKLFIINAAIFVAFIISTMLFLSLFFERFYIKQKIYQTERTLNEFVAGYKKAKTLDEIEKVLLESEENSNTKIIVLNSNLVPKIFRIDGRDKVLRNRLLIDVVKNIGDSEMRFVRKSDDIATFFLSDNQGPIKGIVSVYNYNEKGEIIISATSVQPINEAVFIINKIFLYFIFLALAVVLILSYFYSKIITKPLVQMNKVATKMANLDFSEKCSVQSKDEIGSLANSLNVLSENLNNALTSLKEANAKLEEDIEKEKKLDKMRRDFIAAASHDLKTPIALIEGYAEALKDDIFDDKNKDYYLDIILDETKNMASLVEDMLELSKLESGKLEISKEKFNLDKLVDSTVKKFIGPIQEKSIDLQLNLIENCEVYADWDRIGQVITNLLTNAIKHTNDNGQIIINMLRQDNKIKLEVENSGSHIPEDEIDKIWDLFYKIDKSRNRKFGGTGVGLSIVKSIIEMHGGSYGVNNTPNGVVFYILVPVT
ncbi:Alkaline phosphatase synthesis sensor protein PhoR [Caloramator mitchellensis]|uniref:histidine kinase n=1 Tax=Caloramator mitchellensis TaxID=908809 RepID=A0A0R3JS81_CALMK|nr:HAMP domain-containing sensor histidine kinase [Caloramator mitchellensis]KRQ86375.1 Alkaline phosphatase synthesis sensor protein PhoR [Caloramator mitchellensis]